MLAILNSELPSDLIWGTNYHGNDDIYDNGIFKIENHKSKYVDMYETYQNFKLSNISWVSGIGLTIIFVNLSPLPPLPTVPRISCWFIDELTLNKE